MLHTIEVQPSGSDVGTVMTNTRTWLDHQRFEPDSLRQMKSNSGGICFRLEFKIEEEALAFAAAFDSHVLPLTNDAGKRSVSCGVIRLSAVYS